MPFYEYRCSICGTPTTIRRSIVDMDSPAACPRDGAPAQRVFVPTANLFIPIAFRAATDVSWSDIHGKTERELAQIKELNGRSVEIVPTAEYMSMAGTGDNGKLTAEKQEAKVAPVLEKAFKKAWDKQRIVNL